MNRISSFLKKQPIHLKSLLILMSGLLLVILISLACNAPATDEDIKDTQVALNVQATLLAESEAAENSPNPAEQPAV